VRGPGHRSTSRAESVGGEPTEPAALSWAPWTADVVRPDTFVTTREEREQHMATPNTNASPRTRWASLLAAPLVAGMVGSGLIPPAVAVAQPGSDGAGDGQPPATSAQPTPRADSPTMQVPSTPPTGVRLDRVEWKSANRVA